MYSYFLMHCSVEVADIIYGSCGVAAKYVYVLNNPSYKFGGKSHWICVPLYLIVIRVRLGGLG